MRSQSLSPHTHLCIVATRKTYMEHKEDADKLQISSHVGVHSNLLGTKFDYNSSVILVVSANDMSVLFVAFCNCLMRRLHLDFLGRVKSIRTDSFFCFPPQAYFRNAPVLYALSLPHAVFDARHVVRRVRQHGARCLC